MYLKKEANLIYFQVRQNTEMYKYFQQLIDLVTAQNLAFIDALETEFVGFQTPAHHFVTNQVKIPGQFNEYKTIPGLPVVLVDDVAAYVGLKRAEFVCHKVGLESFYGIIIINIKDDWEFETAPSDDLILLP